MDVQRLFMIYTYFFPFGLENPVMADGVKGNLRHVFTGASPMESQAFTSNQ